MDPSTAKEAVMDHTLAKKEKDDCQDDYEQELSNSERRWFWSSSGRRIRVRCRHCVLSSLASG